MLIISGYSGCGKNTIAKALIKSYVTTIDNIVNVSDIVLSISKDGKGVQLKDNKVILEKLDKVANEKTIIVGIRENYIIDYFVDKYKAHVIILTISEQERINRLVKRGMTLCQVRDKFIDELQVGIFDVIYDGKKGRNKYISSQQTIEHIVEDIAMTVNLYRDSTI